MIFYHGTTPENWLKILEEGVLFGRRHFTDNGITKEVDRCTYLALEPEEANNYGDILLQVEYDPDKDNAKHNKFDKDSWQLRVYEPIPIENVKIIKLQDIKPVYIRFGEMPKDAFSTIYNHGKEVGKENGISCYRVFIDEFGNISICLPLPMTRSRIDTFQGLIEYDDREAFLVTGDFTGYGSEGEPLLRNVRIAKELGKSYRKKE